MPPKASRTGSRPPIIDQLAERPDTFVWLRGFPSLQARDEMKTAFYEGEIWKNELEAIAMPMLDGYEVVVTETAADALTLE